MAILAVASFATVVGTPFAAAESCWDPNSPSEAAYTAACPYWDQPALAANCTCLVAASWDPVTPLATCPVVASSWDPSSPWVACPYSFEKWPGLQKYL